MKHIAQSLGLGLAILAASSAAPRAADWAVGSGGVIKDFGSVKDYRNAAVPVPAPTPAPTYTGKDWYVRGDLGWTVATSADLKTGGGITASSDDLGGAMFGSIGAGRYLTPSIRAEMSFDFRPKKRLTRGTYTWDDSVTKPGGDNALRHATTNTYHMTITQEDKSDVSDQTAFFSLFYDFNKGGRLTPYIGAGLGLDYRRAKRNVDQTNVCHTYDQTDTVTGTTTYDIPCGMNMPYTTGDQYAHAFGLAAAVMAGVGYEVTPGITWDTGYRAVWQGAKVSLGAPGAAGATTIDISNRVDHELRTGIRVDLQ